MIETHYLIDYENVHEKGLIGSKSLTSTDYIHLFFTENAKNGTLDIFVSHGEAELIVKKVPTGAQSLDMHLLSYLGFLIGLNKGKKCEFVIISDDSDYDNVSKFWRENEGVEIFRRAQIAVKEKKQPVLKTTPTNQTPKVTSTKTVPKVNGPAKAKLNQEVQQALSRDETEFNGEIINAVAKVAAQHFGEERFMNQVHNELRTMYPLNYLQVYDAIKPILNKYASMQETDKPGANKTAVNAEIQQILSKADMPSEMINYVASVVVKNIGVKNGKQQIYRTIISKYGQTKGLDVYNKIKKHI